MSIKCILFQLEWTIEAILEMVNLWQNYECLYNSKNPLYHNKHSRYNAFNEIAEKLKIFNECIGPNDVKNKMQYQRGQYSRELSKSKEIRSGSGADDVYVPSAYWFPELSFLQDHIKIRKGKSNLFEQNNSSFEDSAESTQLMEDHLSPAQPSKRIKKENVTPLSSNRPNKEDAVLEAAVNVLEHLTSSNNNNDKSKK
ncbi:uncharacterized protein [Musca autumnalis]|uniref:uncharacterized protein n=1 Tax=Musca autumnalis TaxID=221902 RepID=UPI003CF86D29